MNCLEKIEQALDTAESVVDDTDAEPAARNAAAMLVLARPRITPLIPTDVEQLDAMLARGAEWMLSLRSDDAEIVTLGDGSYFAAADE